LITTNALPYGVCPSEWIKYRQIKNFVEYTSLNHDKVLEFPLQELLRRHDYKFDNNIKSLKRIKGDNVNIEKKEGVGEIDLIFLDEKQCIIYVCECKHNRTRMDINNWKRDYWNFKATYEKQLGNKLSWTDSNKNILGEHFSTIYSEERIDLSTYQTKGLFIINAPTIYMYNGKYRAITLTDFENLLIGQFDDVQFHFINEDSGKEFFVEHPYFDNLARALGE
jgi:hypothetical protein